MGDEQSSYYKVVFPSPIKNFMYENYVASNTIEQSKNVNIITSLNHIIAIQ